MAKKSLKITTFEELKNVADGEVVEFPPFSEGRPFVARIKRPSMLGLVKAGRIPNSLLEEANKMFLGGPKEVMRGKTGDPKVMDSMFSLIEVLSEESFLEPTYQELKEAGVTLTDDQQMFLFSYLQKGVVALKSFRKEWRSVEDNRDAQGAGDGVQAV